MTWIWSSLSRVLHDGMWPWRPLPMVCSISAGVPPYSQTWSVRFGAPSAGLPLPSAPWQAAQVENSGLAAAALAASCGAPDRLSTYWARFFTLSAPRLAHGGITPLGPSWVEGVVSLAVRADMQGPSGRLGAPTRMLALALGWWDAAQVCWNSSVP